MRQQGNQTSAVLYAAADDVRTTVVYETQPDLSAP